MVNSRDESGRLVNEQEYLGSDTPAKTSKMRSTTIIAFAVFSAILASIAFLWSEFYSRFMAGGMARIDPSRAKSWEHVNTGIDPRNVRVWYTKTPKTSGTVAKSLMIGAYRRAGLPVANVKYDPLTALTYANLYASHSYYNESVIREAVSLGRKPVLVVVSTREAKDWYISRRYSANLLTFKQRSNITCDFVQQSRVWCENYSRFLPPSSAGYNPWWVIRHEHVVDDTCEMLLHLGLKCSRADAVGQTSREALSLDNCDLEFDDNVIDCVQAVNRRVFQVSHYHGSAESNSER